MRSRIFKALFGISLAVSIVPPAAAADTTDAPDFDEAAAAAYPGGRRIYTVSLGSIPAPNSTATDAWVRLATYYFSTDGTVQEAFFYWDRDTTVGAASTGVTSAGCDGCAVRTAKGFEPGSGGKSLTGTYTATDSALTITWSGGLRETWNITHPANDVAMIALSGSNYGANVGYGFGSNASSDVFVSVNQVPRKKYTGRYAGYSGGTSGGAAGPSSLDLSPFSTCNGNCLSWLSPPTTTCSACSSGDASPIRYYMAGAGRRNFYEHWCRCLTSAQCYTGGSHRKPQLQVIGDNGTFHGWVGVEASNSAAGTGYFAVHYHVDL
ncbi:hypothetical protein LZC95_02535 [Pendulispora brunnea]|uniref:Uncharacterized protein n=1 Tax=Pendulispora brunnea TaxID=2905690 RepID=A0ABZ2KAL9_9BACT